MGVPDGNRVGVVVGVDVVGDEVGPDVVGEDVGDDVVGTLVGCRVGVLVGDAVRGVHEPLMINVVRFPHRIVISPTSITPPSTDWRTITVSLADRMIAGTLPSNTVGGERSTHSKYKPSIVITVPGGPDEGEIEAISVTFTQVHESRRIAVSSLKHSITTAPVKLFTPP